MEIVVPLIIDPLAVIICVRDRPVLLLLGIRQGIEGVSPDLL